MNIACSGLIPVTFPFLMTKLSGYSSRSSRHDKPGRCQPADPDREGAEPVRTRREPIPTIEIETKKNRFSKERKAFQHKWQAHYCSSELRVGGQSNPNSNERIVPETAPIAKRIAEARVQRLVSCIQTGFFVLNASPSAIHRRSASPTPRTEKMIGTPAMCPSGHGPQVSQA